MCCSFVFAYSSCKETWQNYWTQLCMFSGTVCKQFIQLILIICCLQYVISLSCFVSPSLLANWVTVSEVEHLIGFVYRAVFHFSFTLTSNTSLFFLCLYGLLILYVGTASCKLVCGCGVFCCWIIERRHTGLCGFVSFPWFLLHCSINSWRVTALPVFWKMLFT